MSMEVPVWFLCLLLGFGFQFSYIFVGALFFTIYDLLLLGFRHAEYCSDDLPLWGFVGELHPDKNSDNKHVLYTHKNIIVKYNKDQIIHVNLTQESPKPLEVGRALDMTYSIKWIPINVTFARRFDVYLDYPFFEHQV
ncbi:Transmembrane 9 superfamily member 1 [Camellia lanceoleosa]|uniref:Transmembrane 9 superfamily member 1 n=1 Tax=Camellia lanceoleosa TaxID=1840588 RepID=A0ACC0HYQ2_9ERIC|nr:Transmembrane 9 superfamily member 1 [Camellia lanceoleosa]